MFYMMLPQPHDTHLAPGLLPAPECMLIPHETLLIAVQISCVFQQIQPQTCRRPTLHEK